MRIVVTQNGAEEMKTIKPPSKKIKPKQRKRHFISETQSLDMSEEDDTTTNINAKPRNISIQHITQKKVVIPNDMNEKYINDAEDQSTKAKNDQNLLSDVLLSISKSIDETSNSKLPVIHQAFPLKNIINPERYNKLQEEISEKSKVLSKNIKVTEANFRSEVSKDIEKEFEILSNRPIKIHNKNLIEYLNADNTISTNYVKKLANYDDERIKKLNKISQKVIYGKFQDDIIKNIIQNKIKGEFIKDREYYQDRLKEMKENLKQSHHLVEQDIPKVNKRERYTYQFRQMENFWSKYNIGRYYKKKLKPIQPMNTLENNINMINTQE